MKKLIALVLLMFVSIALFGCKKDRYEIVISEVAHSVFYAPQYVAMTEGFFEDEGLDVSYVTSNGANFVMSALLSNTAQIGLAGAEASVYIYEEGQKDYAVNFAQLTQKDGNFIIGREDVDFEYSMLSGKSILGGRRGGMPEMVLEYALKQNDLEVGRDDPTAEVNVRTDVQFAALAGQFIAGEADYVVLFEPTGTLLEKNKQGFVLASLGEETGIIPYTNYFAVKSYIEENPDIIQKFTNAIYKASQWVYSHTAKEVAEACLPFFPDSTLNDLTIVMQRYMDIEAWAKSPVMNQDAYDLFLDIMDEAGELPDRTPYDKIVTTEFAKKATEK